MIEAFPLTWPAGWKRTSHPQRSRFGTYNNKPSIGKGKDKILDEVRKLGGTNVVISTNLKLKIDGLPYSNQSEPSDRGVAVYFSKEINGKKEPLCIACDSYDKIGCNLYAIGMSIEAMRAMERWGCSEMLNRAFTGFKALGSGEGSPAIVVTKHWWDILLCNPGSSEEIVKSNYRSLVKEYHPDRPDGNAEKFVQINAAWEEAKKLNRWS